MAEAAIHVALAYARTELLFDAVLGDCAWRARGRDVTVEVERSPDVPEVIRVDLSKLRFALGVAVAVALSQARSGNRRLPGAVLRIHLSYDRVIDELSCVLTVDDRQEASFDADAFALAQEVLSAHGGQLGAEEGRVALRFPARAWKDA